MEVQPLREARRRCPYPLEALCRVLPAKPELPMGRHCGDGVRLCGEPPRGSEDERPPGLWDDVEDGREAPAGAAVDEGMVIQMVVGIVEEAVRVRPLRGPTPTAAAARPAGCFVADLARP